MIIDTIKKYLPNFVITMLKNQAWAIRTYQYISQSRVKNYKAICDEQDKQLTSIAHNGNMVAFSILVPVYKPNIPLFKKMIESVISQSYTNWELILVDDASNDAKLTAYLKSLTDLRIKVVKRKNNGHISAASNSGLKVATGDFVVLLDQDDLLHSEALKTVFHWIAKNPTAEIFYSDEDKIDAKGNRYAPHFKPSVNLDLLYSHNYISHLGVYRRTLLNQIGGFRKGLEGSQDYDLLLRAIEVCGLDNVKHIPYVLYHWRAIQGSTAFSESEKSYAEEAGLRALTDRLTKQGAIVELAELPNTYKVIWPLPENNPLVSIIIPTNNRWKLVKQCIDSILNKTDYTNYEILLVDNNSNEVESIEYFQYLANKNIVRLLHYRKPFNYSAINNFAVAKANGNYLVLMNNDIEILSHLWLTDIVRQLNRTDIGCVGAKLYYPNKTIQHAGVITGLGGVAGHSHKHFPKEHSGYFKRLKVTQNLSAVTGACLGVRKDVYLQVGGLNEQELTVAFNDVDFCLRVQENGFRNIWLPYVEMIHHESISRGAEDTPEKQARFALEIAYMESRWREKLLNDPAYNKWLTKDREDFSY